MYSHPRNTTIVYVIEITSVEGHKFSLYENERDAFADAADCAIEHMIEMDCNDPASPSEWRDYYESALKSRDLGDFVDTIATHDTWSGLLFNDEMVNINVYSLSVCPSSGIMFKAPPQRKKNVPSEKVVLPDVPCKLCGRNVNKSETICWNCGVAHPAVPPALA